MTRKLARIAQITDIRPITGADKIECAVVENGWEVVVRKGEYAPGAIAIYCEIDSWVPNELAPFLTSKDHEPREYNGIKGERLRTVRLRGQISQGLLIRPSDIPLHVYASVNENTGESYRFDELVWEIGEDVTADLRIQKWEAPVPAQLAGDAEGAFPSFIPKTDQERCQNLHKEIFTDHYTESYEVTTKLDGTSCTIFIKDGVIGVCSRNWELKETEGNTLWRVARGQGVIDALTMLNELDGCNLAIQGEVIGEGIQGNPEQLKGQEFYVFDIYNIDAGRYMNAYTRAALIVEMQRLCPEARILKAPVVDVGRVLKDQRIDSMEKLLAYAEGPSLNEKVQREGVVFKSVESEFTFKAIANSYLLRHGNR
jgi:RNA ligase (TIGR02306 family)